MPRLGKVISTLALFIATGLFVFSIYAINQLRVAHQTGTEEVRQQNEEVLQRLDALIPEQEQGMVLTPQELQDMEQRELRQQRQEEQLAALEIEGFSCVGILEVPSRNITFAVADISSDTDDCYLPVAEDGYPAHGDFIIHGFDNEAQFASLQELVVGNEVTFTDVDGVTYTYEVVGTARLALSQVEKTLQGEKTGLIVTSEEMQQTGDIDLQLYYEVKGRYRYVVDCRGV